jgi:spore germination cell wall hydrolase CwlJ-like protein
LEAALLCLALNLYHEGAKDEPLPGLFAIAQVTLNRAQRDPAKVCAAVQAYKQFSWTLNPPKVTDDVAWRRALDVAKLSFSMQDFTGGATHYHALYVDPYWKSDMAILGQWGSHIFYKQRGKS